jgi:aldose 1-epimerase
MAPWCGRIAEGRFRFSGSDFRISDAEQAGLGARVWAYDFHRVPAGDALQLETQLPAVDGYPWDLALTVVFSLEGGAQGFEHLSVTISVRNVSGRAAPVSIGWHPYVALPSMEGISNLSVRIPARTKVLTDSRMIPLTGDAAFAGVAAPVTVDYLGQYAFDDSFTELVPTEDGVVVTSLTNPARGEQVLVTQEPAEAPVVTVFTGDGLPRDPRASIAVEPCSAMPNAFNRADSAARILLGPGEVRALTATLSYRPSK